MFELRDLTTHEDARGSRIVPSETSDLEVVPQEISGSGNVKSWKAGEMSAPGPGVALRRPVVHRTD
jgi:hypothetical protein